MLKNKVEDFFAYAAKRQMILQKRQAGENGPWTDDPILKKYRFCNIFREDDKVTIWFRENIRKDLGDTPEAVFACIAFRMFNLPSTAARLHDSWLFTRWDKDKAKAAIKDCKPCVNGAYIVIGKPHFSKGDGICETLTTIWDTRFLLYDNIKRHNSLEQAVQAIASFERQGPFLAYEAVTDLRHTPVLENATDIMTWANPGPGAARGLSRLLGEDKKYFNRNNPSHVETMQEMMQELLKIVNDETTGRWPLWEMRDVEHTLCEFDKYERTRTGEGRPKQLYIPV